MVSTALHGGELLLAGELYHDTMLGGELYHCGYVELAKNIVYNRLTQESFSLEPGAQLSSHHNHVYKIIIDECMIDTCMLITIEKYMNAESMNEE